MKTIPIFAYKTLRICRKYSDSLGSHFFFYSREHEPIHVHVEGNGGYAVYDLDGDSFVLREKQNIKANDQKKIESVIGENKDIIIKRWKEHFEK